MPTPTTIGPNSSWRLIHDGTTVILLGELVGYTTSIHQMFESDNREDCLAEIQRLNLDYPQGELAQ